MSKLADIERQIRELPPEELDELRQWLAELDADAWDAQIEADIRAGKLDKLAAEALEDYKAGRARKL